jgi:hypothetical protein
MDKLPFELHDQIEEKKKWLKGMVKKSLSLGQAANARSQGER